MHFLWRRHVVASTAVLQYFAWTITELLHLQLIKLFCKKNVTQYLVRYCTAIASTARWARVVCKDIEQARNVVHWWLRQKNVAATMANMLAIGYRVEKVLVYRTIRYAVIVVFGLWNGKQGTVQILMQIRVERELRKNWNSVSWVFYSKQLVYFTVQILNATPPGLLDYCCEHYLSYFPESPWGTSVEARLAHISNLLRNLGEK